MEIVKANMQIICEKCDCEFKFGIEDIKQGGGSARKHAVRKYKYVNCPVCGARIELGKK